MKSIRCFFGFHSWLRVKPLVSLEKPFLVVCDRCGKTCERHWPEVNHLNSMGWRWGED